MIDSCIFLATKAVGMSVQIKDMEAYQKELRNDYIINKDLSNLSGQLALKCGRLLAVANIVLITAKHIDFDAVKTIPQQSSEIPQQSSAIPLFFINA